MVTRDRLKERGPSHGARLNAEGRFVKGQITTNRRTESVTGLIGR
jgi:hypothetical protein